MPPLKRIFDASAAFAGLVVLAPVMALVALAVAATSPGGAIFRQARVGRNEQTFVCYKFRTMYRGTAERGTHEVSTSAITPVGRVLRRFKLDELPQLWNVLKGEMSLVGPRPCLSSQEELVAARRRLGVFDIRPGVTGLAQVEGVDMSKPAQLAERDAEYMRRQSFGLDLGLIIRTIFRV